MTQVAGCCVFRVVRAVARSPTRLSMRGRWSACQGAPQTDRPGDAQWQQRRRKQLRKGIIGTLRERSAIREKKFFSGQKTAISPRVARPHGPETQDLTDRRPPNRMTVGRPSVRDRFLGECDFSRHTVCGEENSQGAGPIAKGLRGGGSFPDQNAQRPPSSA